MDTKTKKNYINQNNYQCRFGVYKNLSNIPSKKFIYDSHFNIDEQVHICDVHVKHIHPLLLLDNYQDCQVAIVNNVTNKFDGTNLDSFDGFLDDYLLVRSNYCKTVIPNIYPLHGRPEIIYNHNLSVIRDDTMNFIQDTNNLNTFNQIIISPIENPKLYKNKLKFTDYSLTKELVENIFQTAILNKNNVLILNDFCCKHNKISIDDIIFLYNSNILKYGHYFKDIIVAIPLYEEADRLIYAHFDKSIIKPQNLILDDLDLDLESST